jgi:hypothetical protein
MSIIINESLFLHELNAEVLDIQYFRREGLQHFTTLTAKAHLHGPSNASKSGEGGQYPLQNFARPCSLS